MSAIWAPSTTSCQSLPGAALGPSTPWHSSQQTLGTERSHLGRLEAGACRRNWGVWEQPVPRRCGQSSESMGLSVCVRPWWRWGRAWRGMDVITAGTGEAPSVTEDDNMLPLHFKERTGPQWAGWLEGQGGLWGTWYLCPVGDGREDGRLRMGGGEQGCHICMAT